MDLNRVQVFSRVVTEGSFTKAASALGLPKSSVSRAVSLLEQELGARLLQRSTRKLSLTDAGSAYFAGVSRALAAIEDANAMAAEQQSVPRGIVRMTAPPDAGNDVLLPIIAKFVRKHPTIQVELSFTARIVDLVEEGFDLALRAGPLRDQSLIVRKLAEVHPGLYASRGYLRRMGTPDTVADLASHHCVVFRGARGKVIWDLMSDGRTERVEVTGPLSVDDMGAVRGAAVAGGGIALLPPFICAPDVIAGRLVRVLSDWVGPGAPVSLVYPSARLIPQRVVVLRDFLLDGLVKVPWTCREHV